MFLLLKHIDQIKSQKIIKNFLFDLLTFMTLSSYYYVTGLRNPVKIVLVK